MTTLVFARTYREAQWQIKEQGIPWAQCIYVSSPDTIRALGGTKGLPRVFLRWWDLHPQARAIQDCLFTHDLWDPIGAAS